MLLKIPNTSSHNHAHNGYAGYAAAQLGSNFIDGSSFILSKNTIFLES